MCRRARVGGLVWSTGDEAAGFIPPVPAANGRRFLVPESTERTARRATPPSLSIVIPVYEGAPTIGDAVASALTQTQSALEVIVCDDGSTDDLAGALAPYRQSIRLLRKENGGVASALNCALGAARGDYIAILNADDVYAPTRVEAIGELAAARPDLDIVTTDAYIEAEGDVVGLFSTTTPFVVDDQRFAAAASLRSAAGTSHSRSARTGTSGCE